MLFLTLADPQGLHEPHDVAVDPSGDSVYVGELSPLAVWKLSRQHDNIASQVATAGPTRAPMQIGIENALLAIDQNFLTVPKMCTLTNTYIFS